MMLAVLSPMFATTTVPDYISYIATVKPSVTNIGTFASPEAFTLYADTYQQVRQATWQSPVTAKLLLEAGFSSYVSRWGWMKPWFRH